MKLLAKATTAALLGATLSACGGGSSYDSLLDRTNAYSGTFERVSAMSTSGPNVMNSATGTAGFSGVGAVYVNPFYNYRGELAGDAVLLGDANMTVNFDNNTLGGNVTNLFGVDDTETIDEYSGSVTINNGFIGQNTHNGITANYSGNLQGNGDNMAISGNLTGVFLGNPGVRALDVSGSGSSTLNGASGTSVLAVTAERN